MRMETPSTAVEAAGGPVSKRNLAIQGLRAACVLAIFTFHVLNSGLPPPPQGEFMTDAAWLWRGMRYGVEVFFMISGYVIVNSLRRHASIGAFLQDRVLRIFPLWLPIAFALLLAGYVGARHGAKLPEALNSPAMLLPSLAIMAPVFPVPGIHPAQWSLNYELWFYALAALTWTMGARSAWRIAAWALPTALMVTLFPRGLFFIPGVIVALYEPWFQRHARWLRYAWLGLPLAWVAWLSTDVEAANLSRTLLDLAMEGFGPAVLLAFAGATGFFAWLVVLRGDATRGVLVSPIMQWLGTISYSFYLVHPIVLGAVKRGLLPHLPVHGWAAAALLAILALPLSCLFSWATWQLLEVRLRRWLVAQLKTRRSRRTPNVVAPQIPGEQKSS